MSAREPAASGAATTESAGDASMVTPAMQAAIGREAGRFTIEIDADLVRRLAEALEVDDPELRAALRRDEIGTEVPALGDPDALRPAAAERGAGRPRCAACRQPTSSPSWPRSGSATG